MNPDRSNYEIWFADWLEGNLSDGQKELFIKFLDENPDLKEEIVNLSLSTLSPEKISFENKDSLLKTPKDLLPSQIEYLSAAYFENDLSAEQIEDLNYCINNNPVSRELFDSIRKIKLIPPDHRYLYKERLKKKSAFEKISRLSYIGLSAAAAIAIIVLSYVFVPQFISSKKNTVALTDVQQIEPVILYAQPLKETDEIFSATGSVKEKNIITQALIFGEKLNHNPVLAISNDKDSLKIIRPTGTETGAFRITNFPDFSFDILNYSANHSLIASTISLREPLYDDRNSLSRFLARTFRERILKEGTGSDEPVKPYEIASVGINGLNKIFGSEIALVKISDSTGELKSIYFSSRLLKFNLPVNKQETLK